MLIDTHAHVNFSAFKEEYKDVLQRAQAAGVLVVNVGTQLDTSKEAVEIAVGKGLDPSLQGNQYAVVGLHPVHTYSQELDEEETHFKTREEKFDYEEYKKLALSPKVVGIGECGLDYYRLPENADVSAIKKAQKEAFIQQIRLAKELDKALVIHCRPSAGSQDAYEDILKILDAELLPTLPTLPTGQAGSSLKKEEGSAVSPLFSKEGQGEFRFEIHSFTGSPEIVLEFLKRGAYVGLNGIITFDKTGNMTKVVEVVPLEKIVLETDCPYLTPVPMRGKKNEPAFVEFVAKKVAELKNISISEVETVTSQNAKELFNLNS